MHSRRYQDLKVWQIAVDLAVETYGCTARFPSEERFGLTAQARRAAVSIPCNIAEGQGRGHRGAFVNHLSISRGSLQELETLFVIAERLDYADAGTLETPWEKCGHIGRMLTQLRRSIIR